MESNRLSAENVELSSDEPGFTVKIISDNNTDEKCVIPMDYTVAQLKSILKDGNVTLSSYGVTYDDRQNLKTIMNQNPEGILFATIPAMSKKSTARDLFYSQDNLRIQRVTNEVLKMHWETFHHVTCGLFGYVAWTMSGEQYQSVQTPSRTDVEKRIEELKSGKFDLKNDINTILTWDRMSGDCLSSHISLLAKLKSERSLGSVRWEMLSGDGHAFLTGVNVDGCLFLVDVGIMRECVRFERDSTKTVIPLLGVVNSRNSEATSFRVQRAENNTPTIYFRVTTISNLN